MKHYSIYLNTHNQVTMQFSKKSYMHYFPNLFTYKHFPCGVKIMRAASIFILHLLLFILRHYMQRNAMMYLLSNCFSQFSPVSALRAHVRRFLCHTGQEGPPSLAFCQETG